MVFVGGVEGSILLSGWCGGRGSGDFPRIGCLVSLIYLFPSRLQSLFNFVLLQLNIKTIVAHRGDPTWLPFEIVLAKTERREPRARQKNIFYFLSGYMRVCLFD